MDGIFRLAHLARNHTEKMDRVGLIRFNLQNLPIDLLGSLQPSALMVLKGNRQCLGNRWHNAYP